MVFNFNVIVRERQRYFVFAHNRCAINQRTGLNEHTPDKDCVISDSRKSREGTPSPRASAPNANRQYTKRISEQHGNGLTPDPNHSFQLAVGRHDPVSAKDRLYGTFSVGRAIIVPAMKHAASGARSRIRAGT